MENKAVKNADMERRPLFSVVIPLYNKASTIRETLESVLAQTFENFEVVVVDNASTDGGADIVKSFNSEKIRLLSNPEAGVSLTRNIGIKAAAGEIIAFLDGDDIWHPNHLRQLAALAEKYSSMGAGLYATAYRQVFRKSGVALETLLKPSIMGGAQDILIDNYFKFAKHHNIVWTGAAAAPKRVLEEAGMFKVGAAHGEDLELWAKIALKYKLAYFNSASVDYMLQIDGQATLVKNGADFCSSPLVDLLYEKLGGISDPRLRADAAAYARKNIGYSVKYYLGHPDFPFDKMFSLMHGEIFIPEFKNLHKRPAVRAWLKFKNFFARLFQTKYTVGIFSLASRGSPFCTTSKRL